jgi:hypothetical protein
MGSVTMPLIWDFVREALHAGVPPGRVERCPSSAFGELAEGPPARDRVEDAPQQVKSHDLSVPAPQASRGPFFTPAGTPWMDVHIFRQ